jgi:transcription elongation factor Elf1
MTEEMRKCKRCGETKPITEFAKKRQWHSWSCKACTNADARAKSKAKARKTASVDGTNVNSATRREVRAKYERAHHTGTCKYCGRRQKDVREVEVPHMGKMAMCGTCRKVLGL